ncbi:unnamed protein product [Prorocentrum cordatum]|uniref:DNA helicase n=1 Tax=Prorocentrum cordatum TaxID=2364126 RepID=A0ABN9Q6G7_9DINO|nr:unnamed protein product [Polarella glacialis]
MLEAKQTALSFARRWQSPLVAGGPEDARATPRVPGLFEICGARLMAQAAESADFRTELANQVPSMLLDQLAASCGRGGRLQIQDFVAKVSLDPKDTAAPSSASRRRRHAVRGQGQGVCITTIHAAKGHPCKPVVPCRSRRGGAQPLQPGCRSALHFSRRCSCLTLGAFASLRAPKPMRIEWE